MTRGRSFRSKTLRSKQEHRTSNQDPAVFIVPIALGIGGALEIILAGDAVSFFKAVQLKFE